MTTKGKKTIAIILIILLFLIAYSVYMYIRASNEKFIPLFTGALFALVAVFFINLILKKKISNN